ncbi:MAG: Hsp20/alpha crystallin family protein [Clostridiales bacterium]|nr:Hsp20/alpha crystallin family protein [Clostridiales bacterium]MDY3747277.1 Hsp20/alpha crystallin family protein [Lachnospiraceae bacterium]
MLIPSIFAENLFDDFMRFPFEDEFYGRGRKNPAYTKQEQSVMKTDVREKESTYELDIDLPGYKKEEVSAKLENGYLTISAAKNENKDEQSKNGKYIRRERYSGSMSRSFYVGEGIRQEDIHAKFENGILKLSVPKLEAKQVERNKFISIEG